jgi:hypothetical protein
MIPEVIYMGVVTDLVDALQKAINVAYRYGEKIPRDNHVCGPDAQCDGECADAYYTSKSLGEAEIILESYKEILTAYKERNL